MLQQFGEVGGFARPVCNSVVTSSSSATAKHKKLSEETHAEGRLNEFASTGSSRYAGPRAWQLIVLL